MLQSERPEPTLREIREEFGGRAAELLVILGDTNRLGWVEQRLGESHWRWKHDRLRDALIGRWLAMKVIPDLGPGGLEERHAKLLEMPGAAEAWAWSFAFAPPADAGTLAEILAEHQPLALALSLNISRPQEGAELRGKFIAGLRRALEALNQIPDTFVTSNRVLG